MRAQWVRSGILAFTDARSQSRRFHIHVACGQRTFEYGNTICSCMRWRENPSTALRCIAERFNVVYRSKGYTRHVGWTVKVQIV